ncbi:MAG: STN domain-containing protein [Cytophagales bacterium]|nr:STN domain-containing protein [Cytophaga sp.]
MKKLYKLPALLVCLICSVQLSFGQVLDQKVSIQFQNIPLEQALKKIKMSYGVNFSYSPDQVDVTRIVSLNVSNVTLNQALVKLFKDVPVTYKAVGNQIVLKKGKDVVPVNASRSATKTVTAKAITNTDYTIPVSADTIDDPLSLEIKPLEVTATDSAEAIKELDYTYEKELTGLNIDYKYKKDSLERNVQAFKLKLKENWKSAKNVLATEYHELKDSIMYHKKIKELSPDTIDTGGISDELIPSEGQFTFVYPLGTHMANSELYRNKYSGNLLVGYNGAVNGIEFGGIANIIYKEVHGAQFAGVTNITGEYVRGAQFAGVCNITKEEVIGAQFAGIANVSGGDISGVQAAGIVNVSNGHQMDGVQLAPINEHNGTINGGQIGLINHARRVNGFQLGFINICDTIKGMPIGLLTITKNGYGRVETYYSETTQANLLIKTGVKSFYNIFQVGGNFSSNQYRWTFGYGFGSTVQMSKNTCISFDLIAMHINENEAFTAKINDQAQLRIMLGVNFSKRVSLFVGPTLNTAFSEYTNSSGEIGSKMIPKNAIIYEQTLTTNDGKKIYNPYWIGLNAGIRF